MNVDYGGYYAAKENSKKEREREKAPGKGNGRLVRLQDFSPRPQACFITGQSLCSGPNM